MAPSSHPFQDVVDLLQTRVVQPAWVLEMTLSPKAGDDITIVLEALAEIASRIAEAGNEASNLLLAKGGAS